MTMANDISNNKTSWIERRDPIVAEIGRKERILFDRGVSLVYKMILVIILIAVIFLANSFPANASQITVVKDAVPDDAQDFKFTLKYPSGSLFYFNLDDDPTSLLTWKQMDFFLLQ